MTAIRPATAADLPFIVDANAAMAQETEGLTLDVDVLRAGVRAVLEDRAPGRYWIAEGDGQPIGGLLITYEWSDWRNRMVWWIQSVYISPAARGRGVFKEMYAHIRGEAQSAGAGGLRLYVDKRNDLAKQAYERAGMSADHYELYEWLKN
jgi:GNAT superfamily N-acetyltransferase